MSGVPYSFDGQHRRVPRQNLRGKVVKEPTKIALVERAQNCRTRREKDRLMDISIRTIQALVRGFLARSRLSHAHEAKYWEISSLGTCNSLESHGEQIGRLIKFFNPKDQKYGVAFSKHAEQFLQYQTEIVTKCINEPLWGIRMRKFIRIGFIWFLYNDDTKTKRRTNCHRAGLEFFKKIFYGYGHHQSDWSKALEFFVKVWLDLSTSIDFFRVWQKEYALALNDVPSMPVAERVIVQKTDDIISILKILFDFLTRLGVGPAEYVIDKNLGIWKSYPSSDSARVPKDMISEHLFSLFTDHFIVGKSITSTSGLKSSGELLFPLIGRNDTATDNFPWKDWFMSLSAYLRQDREPQTVRHLLSAALSALPTDMSSDVDDEILEPIASILCKLVPSIDNRFAYPSLLAAMPPEQEKIGDPDEDDDFEDDSLPMSRIIETRELKKYIFERQYVIGKLSDYVRPLPLASWIINGKIRQEAVDAILGCLICNNHKDDLTVAFPFLGQLAYNRVYMGKIYKMLYEGEQVKNETRLINFIWLFHTLLKTFHDVEFADALQLDMNQFGRLLLDLVSKYAENILGTSHPSSVTVNQIFSIFLMALHERNTRLHIFPEEIFQSHAISSICPVRIHNVSTHEFVERTVKPSSLPEQIMYQILHEYPFAIPFHDRVAAWRRMIDLDKRDRFVPHGRRPVIQIRRNMLYEDTFEKVLNVRDIRDPISISLVSKVGMLEAGVDGGGLLREFLIEATKAGVDPNRGLFRDDSQNRIYPNPIARQVVPDYCQHYYLMGRLVGKALYEGTFLELPFSGFFMQKCITGEVDRPVDYLATLDPALHNNLLGLKTFTGDFSSLGLDFTLTLNELGETKTVELKRNGSTIAVDQSNVIEYIHLVANYKINKEVANECNCFRSGLSSVVPILKIFSWKEMQILISGSDKPIDIEDWKRNTNYTSGYQNDHPCIQMFWEVIQKFDEPHLRKLLKFVTSCSRPPLLGFKDLTPNFGIQNAGTSDRLPTAATCMNLLKLPEYDDVETLREKLTYAIEAEAGFELS